MGSGNLKVRSVIVACASFTVLALACAPPGYGEDYFAASRKESGDDDDKSSRSSPAAAGPTDAGIGVDAASVTDAAPATPLPSARPSASVAIPPPPVVQTFALGSNDCAGGHCNGGYDDQKHLN